MPITLELGSAPCEEPCVQVARDEAARYLPLMREECRRFRSLLLDQFGQPPPGATLTIKRFEHDFGPRLKVCVVFDETVKDAVQYAYELEEEIPDTWGE